LLLGLSGRYFANALLQGKPARTQVDNAVDFEWKQVKQRFVVCNVCSHATQWLFGVSDGKNAFSVQWEGYYEARHSGSISFFVSSVGGFRLYVESSPVIDEWAMESVNATRQYCCVIAGQIYGLRIEYRKLTVKLQWNVGDGFVIVPSTMLYSSKMSLSAAPFEIKVEPALTCGTQSYAFGSAISLVQVAESCQIVCQIV
jgi:hypothetical protein